MTLTCRLWDLMQRDRREAIGEYHKNRPRLDPLKEADEISMGDDIEDHVKTTAIDSLDKSFEYRKAIDNFVNHKGKIDNDDKNRFKRLRGVMIKRVLVKTDILFVTYNNAGSDMAADWLE